MQVKYLRDDIYFCDCCAQFYDCVTHKVVDVKYDEMPAEVALNLMCYRQLLASFIKKPKHKRRGNLHRGHK